MYSLWSAGTYNFINFNFLCWGAPALKKTNSGMLFILFFCPPPYVTDTGTILFSLFSTSVCKTYVKKTNLWMLNFSDTSSLKFKYSASAILNLYIAEMMVLFVGNGRTKVRFSGPQPENPRSKKCPSREAIFLKKTNLGSLFHTFLHQPM